MAEQATDTVTGAGAVAGTGAASTVPLGSAPHSEHNSGRRISWIGTFTTIVGFIIGGVAFFPKPDWYLFWAGAAVAIVGCLVLLFSKTMSEDWY